jgi:plasmid stability protein
MANEMLWVQLPTATLQRLRERAEQSHRTVEEEVRDIVTAAVADDAIPADLEADLEALKTADDAALWQVAQTSRLSPAISEEIEELHFKQQREGLTAEERSHLADLMRQYERAMLLRAQAMALLKGRGHNIAGLLQPA